MAALAHVWLHFLSNCYRDCVAKFVLFIPLWHRQLCQPCLSSKGTLCFPALCIYFIQPLIDSPAAIARHLSSDLSGLRSAGVTELSLRRAYERLAWHRRTKWQDEVWACWSQEKLSNQSSRSHTPFAWVFPHSDSVSVASRHQCFKLLRLRYVFAFLSSCPVCGAPVKTDFQSIILVFTPDPCSHFIFYGCLLHLLCVKYLLNIISLILKLIRCIQNLPEVQIK